MEKIVTVHQHWIKAKCPEPPDFAAFRGFSSVKFVVLRVGVCCGVFVWFLVA